ncbi:MAG: HAD family phosphatase, partial [Dehalococcoidia bacterium]
MNVVFDLGGVVVTWDPEGIIASVFSDPAVQSKVRSGVFEHENFLELDRGTLSRQDFIAQAADRTGLPVFDIAHLMEQIPKSLVAIPDTVDLLHRVKARGHRLFCLSNMSAASIEHLESTYSFWEVFDGAVISSRINLIK